MAAKRCRDHLESTVTLRCQAAPQGNSNSQTRHWNRYCWSYFNWCSCCIVILLLRAPVQLSLLQRQPTHPCRRTRSTPATTTAQPCQRAAVCLCFQAPPKLLASLAQLLRLARRWAAPIPHRLAAPKAKAVLCSTKATKGSCLLPLTPCAQPCV